MTTKEFLEKMKSGEFKQDASGRLIQKELSFNPDSIKAKPHDIKETLNFGFYKDQRIINLLRELHNNDKVIYIPGNVPSLKNSRDIQKIYTGKSKCCKASYKKLAVKQYLCSECGSHCELEQRTILGYSKTVIKYFEIVEPSYKANFKHFGNLVKELQRPYMLGFYFIRDSARHFDYINAKQIVQDLMVKHQWIEDDDMMNIIPFSLGFHIDKETAGVILVILPFDIILEMYIKSLNQL